MNLHRNNIQYKGLSLLVAGLFFFSCKKENHSLQLPGEAELPSNTIYADTFSVNLSSTLVYEDFVTSNPSRANVSYIMAGGYQDALLGNATVTAFARLQLSTQYQDLSDIVLDSAYLNLDYNYAHGDTTTTQTLEIYKLTSALDNGASYYSNSAKQTYAGLIGTQSFQARPVTGTNLHIPITDNAFLNSILTGPKNNDDFLSMFNGIAIVPTNNSGAVLRLNLSSGDSRLFIYYHQAGVAKSYLLNFTGKRYFTVDQDRSSTSLSALQNAYDIIPSETTGNNSYLQAGTGLRTKVTFPYLDKFVATHGDVYIHKAELVFPVQGVSPPDSSYLVKVNSEGKPAFTSGVIAAVQSEGAAINGYSTPQYASNSSNAYTFQIRGYLQALVYGEIGNYGLFLTPTRNNIQFNSAILSNQDAVSNQVKLKIYYTSNK